MSGGAAFGRNFFEVSVLPQPRTHVRLSLITERTARARTVTARVYTALLVASRTGSIGSLLAAMAYVTLCDAARTWRPRSQVRADHVLGSACVSVFSGTRSPVVIQDRLTPLGAAILSAAVDRRAAGLARAGSRRRARGAAAHERSAGSR